ncbi:MAG: penicillin acylase family protein [Acidobacteriia bacterium]|nr:penicillin acylase family protein [Terriglobia bacterium]
MFNRFGSTRAIRVLLVLLALPLCQADDIRVAGLSQPVEIIRDRWGVPHIYAQSVHDLFFAQGYITAKDRLWQIDLWRRIGTGKLAEVLGPSAIDRDRLARSVLFRGDWNAEWRSYGPGTREIVSAFTDGINAYIKALGGARPLEFRMAGYSPGLWAPEDCLSRVAGLLMTRNLTREVKRAEQVRRFGMAAVEKFFALDPPAPADVPRGLDLTEITHDIVRVYEQAIGPVAFSTEQGSNNWVVDGSMTVTGKPLLANDPHRPVQIPSLRKTVHLVAPGWNAIGAGEPALPGIALGHNERIGFGFTIVGIDQQDLYVEKLNPADAGEYLYRGAWKKVETERQTVQVKGAPARQIELRFTIHGPILYEDRARHRAYALRWVGSEPGTAGYLAGLAVARARNWNEFVEAMERYHVPSENIVYADTEGNIGWQAAGMAPIRKNWRGVLPVPGDSGEYEWSGFRHAAELPRSYNPATHFIATANHNILPPGYKIPLGYEWALPFRFHRIEEMLHAKKKFSVEDFERMQQDVASLPARRFQAILRRWAPEPGTREAKAVELLLAWDGNLAAASAPALIYEYWMAQLPRAVFGPEIGPDVDLETLLRALEEKPDPKVLAGSLSQALDQAGHEFGPDMTSWQWGARHQIRFHHPLGVRTFDRGPVARPGDAQTVNATSGAAFTQTNGASYREVLDLSDWDRSVITNVPGESGDPESPHYDDLIEDWAAGRYHPLPFTRRAVEAAAVEHIWLLPPVAAAK